MLYEVITAWWKSTPAETEKPVAAADEQVKTNKQKPAAEAQETPAAPPKAATRRPRTRNSPAKKTEKQTPDVELTESRESVTTPPAEKKPARKSSARSGAGSGKGRKGVSGRKTKKETSDESAVASVLPGEIQESKPAA